MSVPVAPAEPSAAALDAGAVRVLETVWIPMSDGCRLAAKLWLPQDAEQAPVPAILEYIPYRRRDHKAIRDQEIHAWFARHGYAGVRVDLRGSGDSEGILRDEYLQQELDDGLEILRWLAAQSWCSGKVGLFGLSWGGFNALQLAALRPPEVDAVVSVCASDDRYSDDVHYMGGCLLTDNLSWASTMFGFNSCPPDPQVVGERWKTMWLERLEGSGLWIKTWLEHQRRTAYWRHGSVCEDYAAIQAPVLAVSGWSDGYTNAVFRLLEHLTVPRRGLVGAWGHKYPHLGGPGPAIDFLGECLRWWDRWLKGVDTGIDGEPMLRAWMQDTTSPLTPRRPGRWVAEESWPTPRITPRAFQLRPRSLEQDQGQPADARIMSIQSPLSCGLFAGKWCSYAEVTDLPWDQRQEDGGALTFDTEPLAQDLEMLGAPEIALEIAADKPVAMVAVRLCDMAPNDRVTRVTYGILNLTHRHDHQDPAPLEPGVFYPIRFRLNYSAQRFPAGHRIRLSISSSYWPLAWPAPEPARLSLKLSGCRLSLPVRTPQEADTYLRPLDGPRYAEGPATTLLAPAKREWVVEQNLAKNEISLNVANDDARVRLDEIDLEIGRNVTERYSYQHNLYDTLRGVVTSERSFKRGGWDIVTRTRTVLASTRTHFLIRATLDAYEGDVRVFSKSWDEAVTRDLI